MRPTVVVVWLGLVAVNGALVVSGRSVSRERAALSARLAEISQQVESERASSSERQRLENLMVLAREKIPTEPLGIAPLRAFLTEAERGLAVERLALGFRPAAQIPAGFDGNRINASFRGSLDGLFAYLERLEAMRLPLSTEALTLRRDADVTTLVISWFALWPLDAEAAPEALVPVDVQSLTAWLDRPRPGNLGRDLFAFRNIPPELEAARSEIARLARPEPDVAEDVVQEAPPMRPSPELTGFVLVRPELETDVRRRVLAAMRYDGTVRLVKVGDRIGGYVVERIDARESVTLTDAGTGERLLLRLE